MKIYYISNGYVCCEGEVACLVIAENEEKALEQGKKYFKEYYDDWNKKYKNSSLNDDYYKNLNIELICEDTNKEGIFYSK